eukprot:3026204-Pleurochrysis_carterae.AAC.1
MIITESCYRPRNSRAARRALKCGSFPTLRQGRLAASPTCSVSVRCAGKPACIIDQLGVKLVPNAIVDLREDPLGVVLSQHKW